MNKFFLIIFYIFNNIVANSQCTILIKQIGKPSDSLIIYGYDLSTQVETYSRLNDSTLKINSNVISPDRMMIMIDKNQRWWTSIWLEPNVNYKELIIDYNKHTVAVNSTGKWDSLTTLTNNLDIKDNFKEELVIVNGYIDKNPDSYLSLWWFTHSQVFSIGNLSDKQRMFNKLNPSLSKYPEYKRVQADLVGRKYPKAGDLFKEFSLDNITDLTFKTEGIKNKWILLNFWSTSCGPCVRELDSLIDFNNSIDTSKAMMISISLDNNQMSWKNSNYSKKMNWNSVWQTDGFYGELCLHYNVYSMPFFILFNKDKKLFYIKDGVEELKNIKNTFKENKLLK
jgi:thiol-disulfide isomerase/thioredoxin